MDADLAATEALSKQGLVARLDLERTRQLTRAGAEALKAQTAVLSRATLVSQALRNDLFLDVAQMPPQKSRLDDLIVRLASLEASIRELVAQIEAADQAIADERNQLARLEDTIVLSTVTGRVWKALVSPGQHVAAGTELIQIIPNSSLVIEAYFHQRHLSDVAVGGTAVVSPMSSRNRFSATVQMVTADVLGRSQLSAPQWTPDRDDVMRVVLTVRDEDRQRLWVGQRVTVRMPAQSPAGRFVSLLLSHLW
jgi:multidrug resistance efflux pump